MLRKIRIILATVMFLCITWLFVDFTGTARHWFAWMPKLQFLEAVLALNVAVIIGLVVLTLVFGRIYCSVICPLVPAPGPLLCLWTHCNESASTRLASRQQHIGQYR